MFWLKKKSSGGEAESVPTATSPSSAPVPPSLEAAIEAATFSLRTYDEEAGPRVMVGCAALGGFHIYDAEEVEKRIRKRYPELPDVAIGRVLSHLESRLRIFLKGATSATSNRPSWVNGWRYEER